MIHYVLRVTFFANPMFAWVCISVSLSLDMLVAKFAVCVAPATLDEPVGINRRQCSFSTREDRVISPQITSCPFRLYLDPSPYFFAADNRNTVSLYRCGYCVSGMELSSSPFPRLRRATIHT